METSEIRRVLLHRLTAMGLEEIHISRLAKDIFMSFSINPLSTLSQINDRLTLLGWDNIELDYHTYSLAKESLSG